MISIIFIITVLPRRRTFNKGEHVEAFRDRGNTYSMFYLPVGKTITVNTSIFPKKIAAWWFNPKGGRVQKITIATASKRMEFTPPVTGIENDWVLVIDDASLNYAAPGKSL